MDTETGFARIPSVIATLGATPQILAAIFAAISDEVSEIPLDSGWAPKDVVAHLLLTDRLSVFGRLRRLVSEDNPDLPSFDEEQELAASGLRNETAAALLAEFAASRESNIRWLAGLGEESLARAGVYAEAGPVRAQEILFHGAYHDANHIRQLLAMIEGLYEPLRGPMRRY